MLPKVRFKPFSSCSRLGLTSSSRAQPRSTGTHAHTSCGLKLNAKAAAAPDGNQAKEACGSNTLPDEGKEHSVMRRAWLIASAGTTLGIGAGKLLMLLATHDIELPA